ncbi:hypothetical protein BDB00DRAFT_760324 [Zychaea mexicana]|uniref:uncharacterized protein n=1 Tax=Zychaea mexicana TaxID=64656 RepID=UPI0022FDC7D3|nr:uncharacterized protein BDB00DRAFT_760324 [Zychaea mexicana]KAI9495319.1 hypothetical protein BDB00DRAFT_760324 [Zychaea mexicana]
MNYLQSTFRATQPFQFASLLRRTFYQTAVRCKDQTAKTSVVTAQVARTRRVWTKEESDTLIRLVKAMGPRWTRIAHQLNRPVSVAFNKYKYLTDTVEYHGPWSQEELDRLRELTKGKNQIEDINWDNVRLQMPRMRPVPILRLTYKYSVDPKIRRGRWTDEEIGRLQHFVSMYGTENWDIVADAMRTRTKRQCLERWRWQQAGGLKKGRYTEAEDQAIIKAVSEYGENFAKVREAIGSQRTARNISQHYRYKLSPDTDRSAWSEEEEHIVYKLCNKYDHDMNKVRTKMGNRRSIKDMWNHYYKIHKQQTAAEAPAKAGSNVKSTSSSISSSSKSKRP